MILFPKSFLFLAYRRASSYAPCAHQTPCAPPPITRDLLSVRITVLMPRPSFPPIKFYFGTLQFSKTTSLVSEQCRPSFSSFSPNESPGVSLSTINPDPPLGPPFGFVLANTE